MLLACTVYIALYKAIHRDFARHPAFVALLSLPGFYGIGWSAFVLAFYVLKKKSACARHAKKKLVIIQHNVNADTQKSRTACEKAAPYAEKLSSRPCFSCSRSPGAARDRHAVPPARSIPLYPPKKKESHDQASALPGVADMERGLSPKNMIARTPRKKQCKSEEAERSDLIR